MDIINYSKIKKVEAELISHKEDYATNAIWRAQAKLLRPMLTFTFDDGTDDHYTTVMPILRDAGMRGTFFIPSDLINSYGHVTTAQIAEMASVGQEIASHTKSHVDLTTITDAQKIAEFTASKKAIESITGKVCETIAYPFGKFNASVLNLASACFNAGRTTQNRYNLYNQRDIMQFNCPFIDPFTLDKAKSLVDSLLVNPPAWLIFGNHRVTTLGGVGIWTTADFQALVAYADSKNIDVVTFAEGARRLKNGMPYNYIQNPTFKPDYGYVGASAYWTRALGYSFVPAGTEVEPIRFADDGKASIIHAINSSSILYQIPETVIGQDYIIEVDVELKNVIGTGFGIRAWELGVWEWHTGTKNVHLTKKFTATNTNQQIRFMLSGSGTVILSNPILRIEI